MWVVLVIISALFLGVYDIFKKISVKENVVVLVLLFSSATSLLLFIPLIVISLVAPEVLADSLFFIPFTNWHDQFLIFIKSIIVLSSWICSFYAMKYLPISIVGPIRSSSPMWTLFGAVLLLHESLTATQWCGILLIIVSLLLYSLLGRKEGIRFSHNVWIYLIFLGTILGSVSALFDKYLIAQCGIPKMEVQAYFSVYQFLLMIPVCLFVWYPKRNEKVFEWRWTIPFIGIFLVCADFFYFYALSIPGALIAVISAIRRSNVLVSFCAGAFLFKEQNILKKGIVLIGVLVGIGILYLN
ncbi:MAG: EamA family transporter [Bacteroidales bacterium]|nr:EamA family transporter [Bacteroidales bacterium]